MSAGAAAQSLKRPVGGRGSIARVPTRRTLASRARDPTTLRLIAFAGLASYAATGWLGLVADPPRGRAVLAVLILVAGAAAMAWLGRRVAGVAAWGWALATAILATSTAAVAIGLPAKLLVPGNWDVLGAQLDSGLQGLGGLTYPYRGAGWSRLVILVGMPLAVGLAAALAFWPARRAGSVLRTMALIALVATYAVGATVSPPGAPLLHGLVLLILIAAWLWLPGLGRREALASAALILAAGALALPLAGQLDAEEPWLDYRNWDWSWSASRGESFDWNHSYGPLDWTRTGQTLFEVKSDAPHYWRAVSLDQFNGYSWLQSTTDGNDAVELPRSPTSSRFSPQTMPLNRDWIHSLTFSIKGLDSRMVVGAGTPLGLQGLDGAAQIQGGLALPTDDPLGSGDTYAVRAYMPHPSVDQMRRAPRRYPGALAPYTLVTVPLRPGFPPGDEEGAAVDQVVPFWRSGGPGKADPILAASPYRGVYRLARTVTAGARTPLEAVQMLESHLRSNYTYSETPPSRQLPLRAFLLRDRLGYCQQFSGAMALMLRMVGIPARVASGFSPGASIQSGTYTVRDFDAHSWVEVYFNDIGWVPFDPTPAAAPARSQAIGLGLGPPRVSAARDGGPGPDGRPGEAAAHRAADAELILLPRVAPAAGGGDPARAGRGLDRERAASP